MTPVTSKEVSCPTVGQLGRLGRSYRRRGQRREREGRRDATWCSRKVPYSIFIFRRLPLLHTASLFLRIFAKASAGHFLELKFGSWFLSNRDIELSFRYRLVYVRRYPRSRCCPNCSNRPNFNSHPVFQFFRPLYSKKSCETGFG